MAKEIKNVVKLQVPGGKATPAPPIGPILGQAGVNIQQFCVQFNEMTREQIGYTIPVVLTVYSDRSFSFITKTPPASDLLRKACIIISSYLPGINRVVEIFEKFHNTGRYF